MNFLKNILVFFLSAIVLFSCTKEATIVPQVEVDSPPSSSIFESIYNTSNSGLLDNMINDIDYSTNIVKIGSDNGYTTFDGTNWNTLTTSNSALPSDIINTVLTDGNST